MLPFFVWPPAAHPAEAAPSGPQLGPVGALSPGEGGGRGIVEVVYSTTKGRCLSGLLRLVSSVLPYRRLIIWLEEAFYCDKYRNSFSITKIF